MGCSTSASWTAGGSRPASTASTGWSIAGDPPGAGDAEALYRKLGDLVLPLYYQDRPRWIWMIKQSISKIGSTFNTQRMMRRYATEAYMR